MYRATIAVAIFVFAAPAAAVEYQQGLDVSRHQGTINWPAVRDAGIKFVFAKATEGVDFVDVNFHQNMAGAIAAGVPIGPYHFGRLNSGETIPTDAIDEANDFVDAIEPYYDSPGMVLRPVLDYEQLPNDPVSPSVKAYTSKWIRDFSGRVQERLGFAPIIYTCCGFNTSRSWNQTSLNTTCGSEKSPGAIRLTPARRRPRATWAFGATGRSGNGAPPAMSLA